MGYDRPKCPFWCEVGATVVTLVLVLVCHIGWFWWRLSVGKIQIDVGDARALPLYLSSGEVWDGLLVAHLASIVAYLAFRHWLCPLRLCERTDRGGKP